MSEFSLMRKICQSDPRTNCENPQKKAFTFSHESNKN